KRVRSEIASVRSGIVTERGITPSVAAEAKSMLDWISMAMLVHPDGEWFRDGEFVPIRETAAAVRVTKADGADETLLETVVEENVLPDDETVKRLLDGFAFGYDGVLTDKSAKITVTEIAKSEDEDRLYLRRPEFAEAGGLTAAEKGTAMHTFMQYADFAAAEADPAAEAERLADYGLLSPEESRSLNIDQIRVFFGSELYGRIKKSDNIRREQKFLIKKSDAALDDKRLMEYNDNSMLQGIADCMFEEDGEIVLIDYKTDRGVGEKTLADRYDLQIKLYGAALGRIFGKRVREAYLYSFALGRAIRVI
ncbi:MAG: PD-(D/E)XK nuclease family protein, partial [Oscillospiraceae bacterium]|nr:PD-(D/E)XK nuclease family protein [Oscillospiraceae bacterium]